MRDLPPISDSERILHAVRDELAIQHGIAERPADNAWLDTLTEMLVARILYAFDVQWNPKWVGDGEPHRWIEGDEHYVECLACGRLTAHPDRTSADDWYERHSIEAHMPRAN